MCGRYTLRTPLQNVIDAFSVQSIPPELFGPRYNVAPTQDVLAVRLSHEGARELVPLHWGLVPHWAADRSVGARMINARSETLAEKPAYRDAFRRRRCLIPADGFFEWAKTPRGGKQPYLFQLKDGGLFAFAGLWESWGRGDDRLESCTILTTRPNDLVRPVHDRMPAILPVEASGAWLDPAATREDLAPLLEPVPADRMAAMQVSQRVNRATVDDPGCVEPAESTLF